MAVGLDDTFFVLLKSEVCALWLERTGCSFLESSQWNVTKWSWEQASHLHFPFSVCKGSGLNTVLKEASRYMEKWYEQLIYFLLLICGSQSVRQLELENIVMLWPSELIVLH